ncbi:O-antigen ligase like membrane protein [Paenibacillus naphthalenovorans]|uniref:O-antigen ligase like membrane protein n=1 Tax=Paenibacillus naphthalenovorans TaxID=162209 RepID=A0A0U2W1S4_9BACL|nr:MULTISPECIES: O-antigen ligase family protein [Paenibacillus]ALS21461.1 O-antigen ligase like membrane protein [Paenibacillus naphthalenovorans]
MLVPNKTLTLVAFLFVTVVCLIPDSKATVFYQVSTPIGTFSPDKVLVLCAMYLSFICLMISRAKTMALSKFPVLIMSAYLFCILFSSYLSVVMGEGYFRINSLVFMLIMNFGVFFAVYLLTTNYESFKNKMIKIVIFLSTFNAILAISQFITRQPLLIEEYLLRERGFFAAGDRVTRSFGFQGEPLALGTVCMVGLIMALGMIVELRRSGKGAKWYIISALILSFGLLTSFSRGNIFATTIVLVLFLIAYKIKISFKLIFRFGLLCVAIFAVLYQTGIWQSFVTRIARTDDESYSHRFSVISNIWDAFHEFGAIMLFGLSPGAGVSIRHITGVLDNNFIKILYESGMIGFVLFLSVILILLFKTKATLLKLCLVALLLNMNTYELTAYSSIGTLFFIILALLSADYVPRMKRSRSSSVPKIASKDMHSSHSA